MDTLTCHCGLFTPTISQNVFTMTATNTNKRVEEREFKFAHNKCNLFNLNFVVVVVVSSVCFVTSDVGTLE